MESLLPLRKVDPSQELPTLELQVLERWRERSVFTESLRLREQAETRVFYEGPPTANGRPGSHHVLTRVFKDMYMRYMTMRGYRVERKAGWDCHGLPVEIAVEQELGISSKSQIESYGIARFNARCRQLVFAYLEDWDRLTERIGFWIDLEHAYRTLDEQYVESLWWALRQIHEKGLLYEGHKVLPYCPRCGTALSSHEVALGYKDVVDLSVYVRMPIRDPIAPLRMGDELLVWTTTPWTLPANAAVAVNPAMTYVRAHDGDPAHPPFLIAETLAQRLLGEGIRILARIPGHALEGMGYEPPFDFIAASEHGARGHTVLLADFVTDEDGTGLVHIVPAFGEEDFRLGQRYGLSVVNPVRLDGTYEERMGAFAGRQIKSSIDDLIADLRARGRLLRSLDYEHSYPHCWRCETALLYYAKPSWYIATSTLRDKLLAENETVEWHPPHIRHGRFGGWLENNVDWALSRERYWGTPLPVWRCAEGHVHVVGSFAELEELSGRTLADHHRPYVDEIEFACRQRTGEGTCGLPTSRVPEVVDVWFDSGAMPFAQHHYPFEHQREFLELFPADFLCEGQDQTRGWFYSLLAVSTLLFDTTPYRKILCLGLILDADGQKMSKSRGNTVEPWEVINAYGADAFRWYFFTAKQPWDGYRFSGEMISEGVRRFLRKLWRTYSFYALYAHANADVLGSASTPVQPTEMPAARSSAGQAQPLSTSEARGEPPLGSMRDARLRDIDGWVMSRTAATAALVAECLDKHDAHAAGRAIAELVDDLSNWYVRRSRRRFWDGEPTAFVTLRTCLLTVAKLLAPFCPFVADEIYDNLDGSLASVHLCDFPGETELPARNPALEEEMALARQAVRLGLRARNAAGIKVRQPLEEVVVVAEASGQAAIERLGDVVCDELNVKRLRFVASVDELGTYEVKANHRTLGPLFGKDMPQVTEAIAALDAARVGVAVSQGQEIGIVVGGRAHSLAAKDLIVAVRPSEHYAIEREDGCVVALRLTIDQPLWREGLVREIVRVVQQTRVTAGLAVEARIELRLDGDPPLLEAAREHLDYLAGETLATQVHLGAGGGVLDESNGWDHVEIEGLRLATALRGLAA
jgi:isoleucyl-tRNA synthetase